MVPRALDELSGKESGRLYVMLRLEVKPTPEGYEVSGVFCTLGSSPTPEPKSTKQSELTFPASLADDSQEVRLPLMRLMPDWLHRRIGEVAQRPSSCAFVH